MSTPFTQAEKDYYILLCRDMTDHDRALVGVVLEALARSARLNEESWTADELDEMAKLTRGQG